MLRKSFPNLTVLAAAFLAVILAGWYLLRPVRIIDQGDIQPVQAKVWTVAQALRAANVRLAPGDQVEPGLHSLLPLSGQVCVRRAIHALVWENGQMRAIDGLGPSAFDLLAQNDIRLAAGDRMLVNGKAANEEALTGGGQAVVLQIIRARTVRLDINGRKREVNTSAATAVRALWDAGVLIGPGGLLSEAPEQLIEENMLIAYRPASQLTIQTGGEVVTGHSSAATVGEALAEAGIALQGMDFSLPPEDQPVPEDGLIQVVRVREEISINQTVLPFETVYEPDSSMDMGSERTVQAGQNGVKAERTRARFEDHKEISRAIDSDWTAAAPLTHTVARGAKVALGGAGTAEGGLEYWKAVEVYATSYSPCQQGTGRCSWGTSSGMRLTKGVIGVTSAWYRLLSGQQVFIPGYGYGVIGDIGGGIPGKPWIDLGWDEENYQPMGGWMTMYLIGPAPEDPDSFVLP